jgi:hypothetical protein
VTSSADAEPLQSLSGVDDGHALELIEHEQIVVPRDDQIGARCECQRKRGLKALLPVGEQMSTIA